MSYHVRKKTYEKVRSGALVSNIIYGAKALLQTCFFISN